MNSTSYSSPSGVSLRDVEASDLPIFFEHQRDPEATRMAAFPARDRESFNTHWARILADPTVITRTILVDGQVAGNMGCFEQDGLREVGYWIGREFWGKGVATAALAQFLTQLPMRPLYGFVAHHNIASARVLQKCVFSVCREEPDGVLMILASDGAAAPAS
jgi:RimJ/RimL family protein N-acetyltransferase